MPYANPDEHRASDRARHRQKPLTPNSAECLQALARAYGSPRHPSELNQHPHVLACLAIRQLAKREGIDQYRITLRGLLHARALVS